MKRRTSILGLGTSLLLVSAAVFATQCRTTRISSGLKNEQEESARKCLEAIDRDYDTRQVRRFNTAELEMYLTKRIGAGQWPCDINMTKAAISMGIRARDGMSSADTLKASGGFFGAELKLGPQAVVVQDNMQTFLWSADATKSTRLPPDKWYVNIIPQRNGNKQPEMLRFIKGGDVNVYWHPEDRSGDPSTFVQWRSTHSATIAEKTDDQGQPILYTVDTPSDYAVPFTGADKTPFHVFRVMPRDASGNALPPEILDATREQVQRWGVLAFDKFGFEGNYDVLAFKAPEQIDTYAKSFLAANIPAFDENGRPFPIRPMYCAWFSFMNANLAYMRPLNKLGLSTIPFDPPNAPPQPMFDFLSSGPANGFLFDRIEARKQIGDGHYKSAYQAPDILKPNNEMLFPPVTAPELIMNFLDRAFGADPMVPEQAWPAFATTKATVMTQMQQQFVQLFQVDPDRRVPPDDRDTGTRRDYEDYNAKIEPAFRELAKLYQDSAALQGQQQVEAREAIRRKYRELVTVERAKPRIPRKWVPPYLYNREAQAFEQFYQDSTEPKYQPRVVYVGTVIHESMLKEWGATEDAVLEPLPEIEETQRDWEELSSWKIAETLRAAGYQQPAEYKDGVDWLLRVLYEQCLGKDPATCDGLNEFEFAALSATRTHWRNFSRDDIGEAYAQNAMVLHNTYGLDPVLFKRILIGYWNNAQKVRPAIYEGQAATVASVATNLRIIFSEAPEKMFAANERKLPKDAQGHPRRTTHMACGAGNTTVLAPGNLVCGNSEFQRPGQNP